MTTSRSRLVSRVLELSRRVVALQAACARTITLALCAALLPTLSAHGQLGTQLPTPVAASELEAMLRAAGADDALLAIALPLHDDYFARFREFEEREVDASLRRAVSPLEFAPSVDDAKRTAEVRRRIFTRAAQLDAALVDEIVGLLTPEAAAKAERVRGALARRRAIAAVPSLGFSRGAHAFDLRSAPALASLDGAARAAIDPAFARYDAELTRQLERLAEASFMRRVRAAEAREELAPPQPAADDAGRDAAFTPEAMRNLQEVQRRAGAEMAGIDAGIRKLHRETLAAIEPLLSPAVASSLRSYLVREVYAATALAGDFDAARSQAEALRAKGGLDDARWTEAESVIRAHDVELRPELDRLLSSYDERAARGDDLLFGSSEPAADAAEIESARERCNAIVARQADALLAVIGVAPARANGDRPAIAIGGGEVGGGGVMVGGGVQIAVMGGDGETISIGMEDLADSGISLGGMFGGGGGATARPMTGEELDALAAKLGFGADTRAVFDEIVARCAAARNEAEEADRAKADAGGEGGDGGVGGVVTMTLDIGGDGGMTFGSSGPTDAIALSKAIEAAEERMFDELKAAADPAKGDAAEAARRARARARLLLDERGAQAADVVAIVEAASLDSAQRALVEETVRAWDEPSVAALRAMRDEVNRASEERDEIMQRATQVEQVDEGDGNTRMGRTMRIDDETGAVLGRLEERIRDARGKIAARNRDAIEAIAAKLESSPAALQAVRRGFYRVIEPGAYRIPRDLEPFFARAAMLEGLRPATRDSIAMIRAEWIASREALCEAFVLEREKERAEAKAGAVPSVASFGAKAQARKRLTADLDQLETTSVRRLRELLTIEFGAEKAASIGELSPRRARNTPMLEIGGGPSAP